MGNNRTAEDNASLDTLRDDIRTLKSDVASLLSGYREDAEDEARRRVAEARRAAGDVAQRGRETARDVTERGRQHAQASHDALGDFIGERPITSIAIAAGAGAVLASLLKK